MSKTISGKNETSDEEILKKFGNQDKFDFVDFYRFDKPLDRGLWVLLIAKEKIKIKRLTPNQIVLIIRDILEISIDSKSVIYSFNRASDKIHIYHHDGEVYYEIMRPGKEYLIGQSKNGSVEVIYFKPGRRYTSKKILSKNILTRLDGELRIVDPYCGEQTLDILHKLKNKKVNLLTRIENLREKNRKRFLREFKDFKTEKVNIELRNFPDSNLHDRYIISDNSLTILGHSLKDLGGKESFAVVLNKESNRNIFATLLENFNRKWKKSVPIN